MEGTAVQAGLQRCGDRVEHQQHDPASTPIFTNPIMFDAAIIGAGPSGSSIARLLVEWGYSVVIIGRESRQPALAETIPPSANRLFQLLEIHDQIASAGFYRTTGNTVWWGSEEPRVELYPEPG